MQVAQGRTLDIIDLMAQHLAWGSHYRGLSVRATSLDLDDHVARWVGRGEQGRGHVLSELTRLRLLSSRLWVFRNSRSGM